MDGWSTLRLSESSETIDFGWKWGIYSAHNIHNLLHLLRWVGVFQYSGFTTVSECLHSQDTRVSWKCQHPPPPAWPRGAGSPCSEPRQSQDTLHWTGVKVTCCSNQGSVTWCPQTYRVIKSWPRLISPFFPPPKLPLRFLQSKSFSALSSVCWCAVTDTKYRVNVRCKMNKRNSNQLSFHVQFIIICPINFVVLLELIVHFCTVNKSVQTCHYYMTKGLSATIILLYHLGKIFWGLWDINSLLHSEQKIHLIETNYSWGLRHELNRVKYIMYALVH